MDSQLLLSEAQDVKANSGATVTSTNAVYIPQVKDHTGTARSDRPNVSDRLHLNCVVEDTAWVGNTAVVNLALYHHTAADAVASGAVLIAVPTITLGASGLADGYQICSIPLPVGIINPYLELKVSVTVANVTAAGLTAWIGGPIQQGGEFGAL
jgi:hypothetical protein